MKTLLLYRLKILGLILGAVSAVAAVAGAVIMLCWLCNNVYGEMPAGMHLATETVRVDTVWRPLQTHAWNTVKIDSIIKIKKGKK